MSIRVMVDGRAYDRTQERRPRPYHKPEPSEKPWWRCAVCGSMWGWMIRSKDGQEFRRHYPGTFWERS